MAIDPEVLHQFDKTAYREHNIVVYNNLYTFQELYCRCFKKALEKDNEIVLMATYYQPIDKVKFILQDYGIDVSYHVDNGSLVIIDSVEGYHKEGNYGTFRLIQSLAERVKKEGKSGIFNFSDMGSFYLSTNPQVLMDYELALPKTLDLPLKGFCCYHETDFVKRLSKEERGALINHHGRAIILSDQSPA